LRVNDNFARHLDKVLGPDDLVWVHDYHLLPLAKALRERGHKNHIGFFLHIPCPPPEMLTVLPHHERLIPSLCDYDLIGFQTGDDAFNFSRYRIWALPHLGNQPVEAIKEDALAEYLQWRVDHAKKTPAISTLRNERTVLNQIFRFAKRKGYISDPPVIGIPPSRQNSELISQRWNGAPSTPICVAT
jgi:hypothetical protein